MIMRYQITNQRKMNKKMTDEATLKKSKTNELKNQHIKST